MVAVLPVLFLLSTLLGDAPGATTSKPIYKSTEAELNLLLPAMQKSVPDLRSRIVAIARMNLGQPYEIYLLGEAPFEAIDNQPVYCLEKSDCVVFAEHTLAMALSDSFPQFLSMLQRIRYRGGQIGVTTRNHYTEADWNKNNTWLASEITSQIGKDTVRPMTQKVNRAKFFKDRYKLDTTLATETIAETYIPYELVGAATAQLRDGDIVNFVTGRGDACWVGHVGLVAHGPDGTVHLIHSAAPSVREETIESYVARATRNNEQKDLAGKPRFVGFKFLRLSDDPWANLRAIDGADAPRVSVPENSTVTWEQYLKSIKLEK